MEYYNQIKVPESGLEVFHDNEAPEAYVPDRSAPEFLPNGPAHVPRGEQQDGPAGMLIGEKGQEAGFVKRQNRICGLRKTTFWLTLALAVMVVVAAAVGGGVGGALANKGHSASGASTSAQSSFASTSTLLPSSDSGATAQSAVSAASPTSTSSSSTPSSTPPPVTSGSTGIAAFSCQNQGTFTANNGNQFRQFCQTDLLNTTLLDQQIQYSFAECIDACANFSGGGCIALTYDANLTRAVPSQGGNCWLKSGEGTQYVDRDLTGSAVLEL